MQIDQRLLEYCADSGESDMLKAFIEHGGFRAAGRAIGKHHTTLMSALERVKARAARDGYAPGHFASGVAPSFKMGKVTVQRNAQGDVERTWERQSPDDADRDAMQKAAYAAMVDKLPRYAPIKPPEYTNSELCTVYTLTDAHIGMLAWHREGGEDWDLAIAERIIIGCFEQAIKQSPKSHYAVLNQLGDLLHYDGLKAVTPTSGHILDADGRFTKMAEVAMRVLRHIIPMILERHEQLHIVLAEGNHDLASSVWLKLAFKALYENETRITVDDSALPFYAYEFGEVMQVFHHSHLRRFNELASKIPSLFPEMWGRTKKRYCHTGNLHHAQEKEDNGITIIQHPTLAARDAYAARGAWFSNRNMSSITYHRKYGQVARTTISPEMLEAA